MAGPIECPLATNKYCLDRICLVAKKEKNDSLLLCMSLANLIANAEYRGKNTSDMTLLASSQQLDDNKIRQRVAEIKLFKAEYKEFGPQEAMHRYLLRTRKNLG